MCVCVCVCVAGVVGTYTRTVFATQSIRTHRESKSEGVIICAGGPTLFQSLFLTLWQLRRVSECEVAVMWLLFERVEVYCVRAYIFTYVCNTNDHVLCKCVIFMFLVCLCLTMHICIAALRLVM